METQFQIAACRRFLWCTAHVDSLCRGTPRPRRVRRSVSGPSAFRQPLPNLSVCAAKAAQPPPLRGGEMGAQQGGAWWKRNGCAKSLSDTVIPEKFTVFPAGICYNKYPARVSGQAAVRTGIVLLCAAGLFWHSRRAPDGYAGACQKPADIVSPAERGTQYPV